MIIKIKKKANGTILIILIVYELFVLFFTFISLYLLAIAFVNNNFVLDFLIISVVLFIVGLFVLDKILWHINGTEIIGVDNEKIELQKKGKIIKSTNTIFLYEIEDIELKEYKTTLYSFWVKKLGIKDGKICIRYLGKETYFGQSLTNKKAAEYIEIIKKIIDSNQATLSPL